MLFLKFSEKELHVSQAIFVVRGEKQRIKWM
jgi:hypothetical protein